MIKTKKNKFFISSIIALILIILGSSYFIFNDKPSSKSYNEFLKDIENNKILRVSLNKSSKLTILTKDGAEYLTDNPNNTTLKEDLLKNNIEVKESNTPPLKDIMLTLLIIGSLGTIVFLSLKKTSLGAKNMLSADSFEAHKDENFSFNFSSMAGNEEAKESVKDIIEFLKTPEKYAKYGARMPKGVILYGEPGTGKTLLAKAVAGEAGVPFYALSGSDFVQLYVGVGASRIRNLFKKAKKNGKAVIFIDEIDAIGKKRDNSKAGGSDERDQTLNALLTEMSGFNENEGIVVMAATNRLDMLDSALLRPGRFDRHIEVSLPDVSAREKIINLYLEGKPHKDLDIKDLAKKTSYFSGAKLENLINEAAIIACKESSDYIYDIHLDKAFSIVVAGYEKVNKEGIKEEDKNITAYHEAGHAILSKLVLPEDKLSKVTIIPTSKGAGGYTLTIPHDSSYQNLSYLHNRIKVLLGGRAAEEIIFGKNKITTGAYNDLKQATNIISSMITSYGMGESLGLLSLSELQNLGGINTSEVLDECKDTVYKLYEETKALLIENEDVLHSLAKSLLDKETLYEEDIYKLVS
ncbi:ATP-dependent metallopeptidase FtsH/Yme1/Tma family protein [Clostridium hydrogeniformans]|uniref:ATP-dependent metallopeptidase FtsH/Yme1/Tma family protein n=1 Tax=Clostridium hydrogeniformans TaxID=349933 RepID=UPI000482016F|nr:ATP-dependent metallopeptidase FtsH/Yme1/Tma family protein [Clostridium hydrogeniformans]